MQEKKIPTIMSREAVEREQNWCRIRQKVALPRKLLFAVVGAVVIVGGGV